MKKVAWFFVLLLSLSVKIETAQAFCGFYVAKADTKIFNKASQVVWRDGRQDRDHHGQRLQRRSEGVRCRDPRSDPDRTRPDQRRR